MEIIQQPIEQIKLGNYDLKQLVIHPKCSTGNPTDGR